MQYIFFCGIITFEGNYRDTEMSISPSPRVHESEVNLATQLLLLATTLLAVHACMIMLQDPFYLEMLRATIDALYGIRDLTTDDIVAAPKRLLFGSLRAVTNIGGAGMETLIMFVEVATLGIRG